MAYFDQNTFLDTPEQEEERRRQFLQRFMAQPPQPVLQPRTDQPPPALTANVPGTRAYDLSVGATTQPTVPTPRTTPAEAPTIGSPNFPTLSAPPVRPARPDVMPTREDFPAKPELSGWKKVLGLGLATLAGPQRAGDIANQILHGQQGAAERRYQQATQDWEREQQDKLRAAQTAKTWQEAQPKPEKPEKPENLDREAYDYYISQGMTPAAARKQVLKDAVETKPEQKENKAVAGTIKDPRTGKEQLAWGVQTDKGWVDPQTQASIPGFKPPPNYAQVAPGLKTVDILDPSTGLPVVQTLGGRTVGVAGTGAYGHEAAQAGAVTRAGNQLINEVNANKDKLGNVQAIIESALLNTPWADPKTAKLRSLIASYAALQPSMHGFRGMNAVQQFEKLLGGMPNNPDALIAAIQGIQSTAGAINPALVSPPQAPKGGGFKPF